MPDKNKNAALIKFIDELTEKDPQTLIALTDDLERERCKNDLFYLSTVVLGYTYPVPRLHKYLCVEIEKINPILDLKMKDPKIEVPDEIKLKRVWVWFRGGIKTTLITICHSIQLIIRNPEISILLGMNTLDIAKDKMQEIKGHFTDNERFRDLFPYLCPKVNKSGTIEFGTQDQFTIPGKKIKKSQPTMRAAGVGTTLTSGHFDYHKYDDLVTDQTVGNVTQLDSSIKWYGYAQHLYDNRAESPFQDYTGTPYHFNDLLARLRQRGDFQESYMPIIINQQFIDYFKTIGGNIEGLELGQPAWPERYTLKGINDIRTDPQMGRFNFNSQCLLCPIDPERQELKEEYLTYWEELAAYLNTYILIDPASRTKKGNDYTAWTVISIGCDGIWYKREQGRAHLDPAGRIKLVFRLVAKYRNDRDNLQRVVYENVGFQDTDMFNIKQKFTDNPDYIPFRITPVPASSASKADRIRGLIPLYENGKIKFNPNFDFSEFIDKEYLQFSVDANGRILCEHDDMLDSESFMLRLPKIRVPEQLEVKEARTDTGTLGFMLSPGNINRCLNAVQGRSRVYSRGGRGMSNSRMLKDFIEGRG